MNQEQSIYHQQHQQTIQNQFEKKCSIDSDDENVEVIDEHNIEDKVQEFQIISYKEDEKKKYHPNHSQQNHVGEVGPVLRMESVPDLCN